MKPPDARSRPATNGPAIVQSTPRQRLTANGAPSCRHDELVLALRQAVSRERRRARILETLDQAWTVAELRRWLSEREDLPCDCPRLEAVA